MKNRVSGIFLVIIALFSALSHAADSVFVKNPDFVMAVFATTRSRADLLDRGPAGNFIAYNITAKSSVDIPNGVVRDVIAHKDGEWIDVAEAPLPDVVYDFGVFKNAPKKKAAANILKEQLRAHGVLFTNPEKMAAVNDKMLFAEVMAENGILHPQSWEFNKQNLLKMLDELGQVFVKPTFGSKGYGIIVVQKNDNSYSLSFKRQDRDDKWISERREGISRDNIFKAVTIVQRKLGQKKAKYFIQKGVPTFRYDDKQTDFRVNIQRGERGLLKITGFIMRVGGNVSQGGRPAGHVEVLEPLEEKCRLSIKTLKVLVSATAIKTFLALEKHAGETIGDLGMDLVVDEDGNPYIIEANDKNGYLHMHVLRHKEMDSLFGLPSIKDKSKKVDDAHTEELIQYARNRVMNARAQTDH